MIGPSVVLTFLVGTLAWFIFVTARQVPPSPRRTVLVAAMIPVVVQVVLQAIQIVVSFTRIDWAAPNISVAGTIAMNLIGIVTLLVWWLFHGAWLNVLATVAVSGWVVFINPRRPLRQA
jgi:hypothetical protein